MKFNNETKVGILATVAITLLILGFNFMKGDKLFKSGFELHAYFEDANGLSQGNPVVYNGLRVGTIKEIGMNEVSGKIHARFSLEKGLQIPVDSKAIIMSDLLGSKALKLERGNLEQMVESGAVLDGMLQASLEEKVMDEILPLKDNIGDLITQMERFMGWLNNTMDESTGNKIDDMMDNFSITARNLSRTSYRVDTLLGTFQTTAYNANRVIRNLRDQNETINRIMNNAATFSDTLALTSSNIKGIMQETEKIVGSLTNVMTKVENGEGTMGMLVSDDSLYYNIRETTTSLEKLVSGLSDDPKLKHEVKILLGDPDRRARRKAARDQRRAEKEAAKEARGSGGEEEEGSEE